MRIITALILLVCTPALAQQGDGLVPIPEGFKRARAIVEVREQQSGTSELTVSFVEPNYSRAAIDRHAEAWRAHSGRPLLSSTVSERKVPMPDGKTMVITRWVVTTHGIVDRKTGALDVQAVARALSEIQDLDVLWLVPSFPYRGFGTFKSDAATMSAVAGPDNVHMFVHVSATDPKDVVIPSIFTAPPPEQKQSVRKPWPLGMYILVAIGGSVLVGVLVYYVLRLSAGGEGR
ncbi:MAG: hypothetical protein HRF45_07345 [Fimbriimonadia bacterium]|jgi:hypothetical protein